MCSRQRIQRVLTVVVGHACAPGLQVALKNEMKFAACSVGAGAIDEINFMAMQRTGRHGAPPKSARTHALRHARSRTHPHARARTHTHTHIHEHTRKCTSTSTRVNALDVALAT